ncbi:hypothetical protein [uncultured Pontibacter sp.]|uniref:hypothetical protein n=1 Tax=uncultured Pontibacter sp. TaxID=453356 RepID=UPI0026221283|nr:hypothetical protein [uncultured Pontibacter sp.]
MRWTLLLLLLLCSCATQRQAEKFFEENPDKLAEFVAEHDTYTLKQGKAYAAKYFSPKYYPPGITQQSKVNPERLLTNPMLVPWSHTSHAGGAKSCPECTTTYITKTLYLKDTVQLDSLHRELATERLSKSAIRQKLAETEVERDYWQEMNRKKFWTLVAMAVFAFLYILFKMLASRVKTTEK